MNAMANPIIASIVRDAQGYALSDNTDDVADDAALRIEAYYLAVLDLVRDACAKVADDHARWDLNRPNKHQGIGNRYANQNAREIARVIRSLELSTILQRGGTK